MYFDRNWRVCPSCGMDWVYHVDDTEYLYAIAITDWNIDRTVAYRCPECDDEWPVERL